MRNLNPDALVATADTLARWTHWHGEFAESGCDDADATLRAYWKRGYLHALTSIMQGYDVQELAARAIQDANELINPEEEDE